MISVVYRLTALGMVEAACEAFRWDMQNNFGKTVLAFDA